MTPADTTSVGLGIFGAYLIQWAKASPWKLLAPIRKDNPAVVRSVSVLLAAVTAAGVSWTWDGSGGTLVISGLTPDHLAAFVLEVARQALLQDFAFRAGFKGKGTPPSQGVPEIPQA